MSFQYLQDAAVGIVKAQSEAGHGVWLEDSHNPGNEIEMTPEYIRGLKPTLENIEMLEALVKASEEDDWDEED